MYESTVDEQRKRDLYDLYERPSMYNRWYVALVLKLRHD